MELQVDNLVSAQAINKYEHDEMMPSSSVLIRLARALDVAEDYLLGEPDMALDGVEFRKKSSMAAKEESRIEAQVLHLMERYLMVEEILGLPVEWDEPRGAPYPVEQNLNESDRAAHILRDHWGLGLEPIPKFVELLESRGSERLPDARGIHVE